MKSTKIDLNKEVNWPQKCAYCNQKAQAIAKTNFRVIDGYLFVALRESIHTINYPVCNKHKWVARFYEFVTNQSFPTGFVMVLAFPLLFSMPIVLGSNLDSSYHSIVTIGTYVLFTLWVLYLKIMNPVKITKAKKNIAYVRLKNKEYSNEFELANK